MRASKKKIITFQIGSSVVMLAVVPAINYRSSGWRLDDVAICDAVG